MQPRYSIRIPSSGTKTLLVVDSTTSASVAIDKALRLPKSNVHDRQTGNVYVPSLRQWVKAATFATLRGSYGQSKRDKQAESRMLADLAMWSQEGQAEAFSAEGC